MLSDILLGGHWPMKKRPSDRKSAGKRPCSNWTPLPRCSTSNRSSWRRSKRKGNTKDVKQVSMGWELDFLGPSYIKKNYFFFLFSSVILSISPNCCNCMECFSRFSLFYYLYSLTASTCCRTESEKKKKTKGMCIYIYIQHWKGICPARIDTERPMHRLGKEKKRKEKKVNRKRRERERTRKRNALYRLIGWFIPTTADLGGACAFSDALFRDCHRFAPSVHHVLRVANGQIYRDRMSRKEKKRKKCV